MQKCIECPRFLSMKWFTKGEIFTSCFNFDLNRSVSKKKRGSKMSIFKPCQKNVSRPCKWQCTGTVSGGLEKNWVCFLKYLPNKTPIFKEKIVPKSAILAQTPPPDAHCRFLLEVKQMPVSSVIWSTNYTQSMREGFVWPFPIILLNP